MRRAHPDWTFGFCISCKLPAVLDLGYGDKHPWCYLNDANLAFRAAGTTHKKMGRPTKGPAANQSALL